VLIEPRSNSLILRASTRPGGDRARSIVAKLDQPAPARAGNIWVVYLKNADAVKLAAVLRAAFAAQAPGGASDAAGLKRHRIGAAGAPPAR
jgi:general secretion pathway protein D